MPLLAFSCARTLEPEAIEAEVLSESIAEEQTAAKPGIANVKFSDEMISIIENDVKAGKLVTKSMQLNSALDELGVVSMRRLFPDAGEFEPRTRKEGLHRWYVVEFDKSVPLTKAKSELGSLDGVEFFEKCYPIKGTSETPVFDDPYFPYQWHYFNDGKDGKKAGADVNVLPVWKNYTKGDPKVIVGVIDGGVDSTHTDLNGGIVLKTSKCFISGSKFSPHDHGTHVAGTIAARNNNGAFLSGIAGGDAKTGTKGVRILSCQIFENNQKYDGDSEAAIKYAADHGAVISQNSWGYDFTDSQGHFNEKEAKEFVNPQSLLDAIDYFIKYAGCDNSGNQLPTSPMKGGVVFFSAGNDNSKYGHPGDYEKVIAVGAIGATAKKASYSNYGDWVDICAPGGDGDMWIWSCGIGNDVVGMQGTSMACPHVSGAAALVVSYHGGIGFTNEMLKERILQTQNRTIVSSTSKIGGLVDALAAISYGDKTVPEPVSEVTPEVFSNRISLSWKVGKGSMDKPAHGFIVLYGKDKTVIEKADPANPGSTLYSMVETGDKAIGDNISVTIDELEFETEYHFAVYPYTFSKVFAETAPVVSATTTVNHAPAISTTYDGSWTLRSYSIVNAPFSILEPDGHEFTYEFTPGSAAATFTEAVGGEGFILKVQAPLVDPGTYTATIKAKDKYGASSQKDIQYTVLPNSVPKVVKKIPDTVLPGKGEQCSFTLSEYFTDDDGEELAYTATATPAGSIHPNVQKGVLYCSSLGEGEATIEVVAKDAKGAQVSSSFTILARNPETKPVDIYPNPATDYIFVRPVEAGTTNVSIFSKSGAKVASASSSTTFFTPMKIDVKELPAGVYYVNVASTSGQFTYTIVKL